MTTQRIFLFLLPALLAANSACRDNAAAHKLPEKAETKPSEATQPNAPQADPEKAEADSGMILSGQIEPHRRSTLTPQASGSVAKVHVRDGDYVAAGDPLVTFDPDDFALRVRAAEAGYEAAVVAREAAKVEWERLKGLVKERSVPQSQLDQVDAQYRGALAGAAQAEAARDMALKSQRDSVVRAPFAGVIVKRHVTEGEYATVMPATPLVTLDEIDTVDIHLQVPASMAQRIAVGARLALQVTSLNRELQVTVTRVVPSLDGRTRNFSVIAETPNPDHTLWPGLFVQARALP